MYKIFFLNGHEYSTQENISLFELINYFKYNKSISSLDSINQVDETKK